MITAKENNIVLRPSVHGKSNQQTDLGGDGCCARCNLQDDDADERSNC
ncbi:MAG: hypothetical protein V7K35_12640 [Nostoc sp.]